LMLRFFIRAILSRIPSLSRVPLSVMQIEIPHSAGTLSDPFVFYAWLHDSPVLVFSLKENRSFSYFGSVSGDYIQRVYYLNESPTTWDRVYDSVFNNIYVSTSLTNVTDYQNSLQR